jgi:hypothetical protein
VRASNSAIGGMLLAVAASHVGEDDESRWSRSPSAHLELIQDRLIAFTSRLRCSIVIWRSVSCYLKMRIFCIGDQQILHVIGPIIGATCPLS